MPALTSAAMRANHVVDDAWCKGCGLYFQTHGEHRPDCTAEPSPLLCEDCGAIRLPSERGRPWRATTSNTYHCPTHQKGA